MAHPQPLFILAPPRSFTSVVCGVIGQHPDILGMPELNMFQAETMDEFWRGRQADGTPRSPFWRLMRHDGILRAVAQLYGGEQTMDTVDLARRWITSRSELSTGDAYTELCEKVSPRILLDKSPAYARRRDYLDRIVEHFPDAKFIHLTRHPRGQCESVLKADGGKLIAFFMGGIEESSDGQVFIDPQDNWRDSHRTILEFLTTLPRENWMRIIGEDFMTDIDAGAREVAAWLNLDTSPAAIDAMKHPEDSPFACLGPAGARMGNDPNFLEAPALRPGNVKHWSCDEPLPWRPDHAPLKDDVVRIARYFGYS